MATNIQLSSRDAKKLAHLLYRWYNDGDTPNRNALNKYLRIYGLPELRGTGISRETTHKFVESLKHAVLEDGIG